jgi:hypothetical protein
MICFYVYNSYTLVMCAITIRELTSLITSLFWLCTDKVDFKLCYLYDNSVPRACKKAEWRSGSA